MQKTTVEAQALMENGNICFITATFAVSRGVRRKDIRERLWKLARDEAVKHDTTVLELVILTENAVPAVEPE